MATLKNTTLTNLNVTNDLTVVGESNVSNPTHVRVYYDSDSTYNTVGNIPFNVRPITDGITINASGSRYTILEAGTYVITFHNISSADGNLTNTILRINGVNIGYARGEGTPNYPMVNIFHLADLDVGDYIEMYHSSGTIYLTNVYNDLCIHRIF